MLIRKIEVGDAQEFLEMQCILDSQTKNMMYEEGERPRNIDDVKQMLEKLEQEGSMIFVAEENGKLIGFLSAQKGQFRRIRHTCYIVIGILIGYRGRGVGSALFLELDKWSRANGITRLELTVMCHNKEGVRLYRKNGFEVEGIRKHSMMVDGQYVDEYYMAKILD